jgi:hypothetical protein
MSYTPQVNDYVTWKHIQGWVYFRTNSYVTIEAYVKPKHPEDYQVSPIHANNRLLILCYSNQWKELTYVKSRNSIHEE